MYPPETYREYHTKILETNKEAARFIDDFVVALKALDADKLEKLAKDFENTQEQSDALQVQLNKKIVEESVLRKYIDQAASADNKINMILNKA